MSENREKSTLVSHGRIGGITCRVHKLGKEEVHILPGVQAEPKTQSDKLTYLFSTKNSPK